MNERADMHVHSTFSDGRDRIEDNIAECEELGLTALGCVDHVRVDTDWVPDYVAAVGRLRSETAVQLRCGIEAKLLDTTGALDLPTEITASTRSTPPTTRCRWPRGRPIRARCASGSPPATSAPRP